MSKKDTRNRIIETASRLFYKNGYNLTGINEIIAESGIAKATLYSHFRSKEEICIAYLKYKNQSFTTVIETYCEKLPEGNQQILAFFDFLSKFFEDVDFTGCWCIRTISELPQENEKIKAEIQQQKKEFIEIIERVVHRNKPKLLAQELHSLSRQVYLLYESAVSESYLHQDKWPIEIARSMCKQLL